MLHGIVALCPRAGSLLFARAYAPSFGLPLPSGGQPIDAHNLASLVFALQLNATAVLDGNSEDPTHGSANPALKSIDMGPGLRLVFYQDAKLPGLLLTLSLDPALGDRAQRRLAECICDAFAEAFGEQLRRHASGAGAPGPVRRLRGATELVQRCFASVSQFLLQDLMQTFSDTGSIMWGHAMQPETHELEALSIVRPREVSGEHVAGWNFEMGGLPSNVQELQILPAAHATGFDGVSAAGDAVGRGRGGDSPGVSSGGKRKAPEKLLSKCSQILRKARRCFRDKTAANVHTALPQIPAWCTTHSVFVDATNSAGNSSRASVRGEAVVGPSEQVLRDVLSLLKEPSSTSAGKGRWGVGGGVGGVCHSGAAASCSLWGSMRIWQDKMLVCDGEWRRCAAVASDETLNTPPASPGGCSSFLRSRQRKSAGRVGARSPPPNVSTDAENGGEDGSAADGSGGRVLVAIAGQSIVVSFCVLGSAAGISREEGKAAAGEMAAVVELEGATPCTWAGGEDDVWIRREEALWRLATWMRR